MSAGDGELAGVGVLVTRPAHQAEPLCAELERRGATVTRFPVLAIGPPEDPAARDQGIQRLAVMDWVIFVSPNAVHALLGRLHELGCAWPTGVRTAGVGAGTAAALDEWGLHVDCLPDTGVDSESLLAQPAFRQMTGRRTMLVRGDGGREILRQTLETRGAEVDVVTAYRRLRPATDPAVLDAAWAGGALDVAVVTSSTALDNLLTLAGPRRRERLLATGLVVISERVAARASGLGFANGIVAIEGTSAAAMSDAVARWANENRRQANP